jgi:hypothetical protein
MGASIPRDSLGQRMSGSFYGNENPVNLGAQAEARRTMPGGPVLPKLPRNPYAIAARQAVEHSVFHRPHQPRNLL